MPKRKVGDLRQGENETVERWNGAEWERVRSMDRVPSESDKPEIIAEEQTLP